MKQNYIILFAISILVSCATNIKTNAPSQLFDGKSYSERVVGNWISKDNGTYTEIIYSMNNTSRIVWFEDDSKQHIIFDIEFEWQIEDKTLTNKLTKVLYQDQSMTGLDIGQIKIYEIVTLTDSDFVIRDENGTKYSMQRR